MRTLTLPIHFRSLRYAAKHGCQLVRESDFSLVGDTLLNVSLSGALVGPTDPTLIGERLLLSFKIPHSDMWIDSEVTVARLIAGRRTGEFRSAIGVRFDRLPGELKDALRGSFARVPVIPPGYRPGRRASKLGTRLLARMSGGWAVSVPA